MFRSSEKIYSCKAAEPHKLGVTCLKFYILDARRSSVCYVYYSLDGGEYRPLGTLTEEMIKAAGGQGKRI